MKIRYRYKMKHDLQLHIFYLTQKTILENFLAKFYVSSATNQLENLKNKKQRQPNKLCT